MSTSHVFRPDLVQIRSAWWTFWAILLEAVLLLVVAQFALFAWEAVQSKQPWHGFISAPGGEVIPWWVGFFVVEGLLNVVEWQIGRRSLKEEGTHRTVPFVWVPGGRVLRLGLMVALSVPVLLLKLLFYFVWMTLLVPGVWARGHLFGRGIDRVDRVWAYPEFFVNSIFNALSYCKVNPRSSAFTSFFNLSLSMWCLNH